MEIINKMFLIILVTIGGLTIKNNHLIRKARNTQNLVGRKAH